MAMTMMVMSFETSHMTLSMVPKQITGKINPLRPGHVAQSVGYLTRKSGVLGSIPGLAKYFRFKCG